MPTTPGTPGVRCQPGSQRWITAAPPSRRHQNRTELPSATPITAETEHSISKSWSHGLVSRSGDPGAVASNRVDDLVGGLGPLEGLGVVVPELDPLFEGAGQLVDRAEDATVEPAALQFSEPSLDLVEPRGVGGGEVQLEPRVLQQPPLDRRGLV